MPLAIWSGLIASLAPRGPPVPMCTIGIGRRLASRTGIFLPNVRPGSQLMNVWRMDDCCPVCAWNRPASPLIPRRSEDVAGAVVPPGTRSTRATTNEVAKASS